MKIFSKDFPSVVLAILIGAISFGISSALDSAVEFNAYSEPFPDVLPAGCCIYTNGEQWEVRERTGIHGATRMHWIAGIGVENEKEAIYWAWRMKEVHRKGRHTSYIAPPEKPMRPLYPELCKPKK